MKKFLIPSLLALLVAGLGQREAKAGVSVNISIGGHGHRPVPPAVIVAPAPCPPPVVVYRPPVVVYPTVVRCGYGHPHAYVKSCEHHYRPQGHGYGYSHGYKGGYRDHDRHDGGRGHRH